ncbi:transcriptional regulator, y4mF family [Serratia liquefaciens]|uniref:helix-turn-helix transcriptional regulator n=1 Tax=Serratia liquefaciens TaxID=614 RepID=UPI002183E470|nr:helix-turn-helix transcriptional regulator [Serratia liquefaciens]CAI2407061.1 transcriptional regulator, y4mF family [Serratia liquefaciens]
MNNIQVIRKRLGLTQSELAQLAGCTPGAICHYEAGRRSMDIQTCRGFVEIFNKLGESVGLDEVFPPTKQSESNPSN